MKPTLKMPLAFLVFALAAVLFAVPSAQAQRLTTLHIFTGSPDGDEPNAGVLRDSKGSLYGTTFGGGAYNSGAVFQVRPAAAEIVLYSFSGGADGAYPVAGLIRDEAGNLYGTTAYGGAYGSGTVFKVDPSGKESVLYSFTGGSDGAQPFAGLIRDDAGNLYGTTYTGGDHTSYCGEGSPGCGVVFKLDTANKETVLHTFTGPPDGDYPEAGLIRDAQGNLYGTTRLGGDLACANIEPYGCGTVFEVDHTGKEKVLYSFAGEADGSQPAAGVILDAAGNLYGTTMFGGDFEGYCNPYGCGVAFKLDPANKETVLHIFTAPPDGNSPEAGLIQDKKGNLYGTTEFGGTLGGGTVFELTTTGTETVLYNFSDDGPSGRFPTAPLIGDGKGNAYGTAVQGGDANCGSQYGCGTVFEISPR
jgi:uncharacterized repeat protein (TIGR03803 family)